MASEFLGFEPPVVRLQRFRCSSVLQGVSDGGFGASGFSFQGFELQGWGFSWFGSLRAT